MEIAILMAVLAVAVLVHQYYMPGFSKQYEQGHDSKPKKPYKPKPEPEKKEEKEIKPDDKIVMTRKYLEGLMKEIFGKFMDNQDNAE